MTLNTGFDYFLEHFFGTFNRPDVFDANGSTIAHFAAQREDPAPLFRCLKDLGTPLARTNKVRTQNKLIRISSQWAGRIRY